MLINYLGGVSSLRIMSVFYFVVAIVAGMLLVIQVLQMLRLWKSSKDRKRDWLKFIKPFIISMVCVFLIFLFYDLFSVQAGFHASSLLSQQLEEKAGWLAIHLSQNGFGLPIRFVGDSFSWVKMQVYQLLGYGIYIMQMLCIAGGVWYGWRFYKTNNTQPEWIIYIQRKLGQVLLYACLVVAVLFVGFRGAPSEVLAVYQHEYNAYQIQLQQERAENQAAEKKHRIEQARRITGTIIDRFDCLQCSQEKPNDLKVLFRSPSSTLVRDAYLIRIEDQLIQVEKTEFDHLAIGENVRVLYDDQGVFQIDSM